MPECSRLFRFYPGQLMPRVSILMAVRESRFLAPAMETLLAQTMPNFELVVVDDASDSETQDRLAAYATRDGRVRILRREAADGLPVALNHGLAECRGPLIARADADDVYHPERLARQVATFDARPTLAALSCGWRRIDEAGRTLYTHRPYTGPAALRFLVMFLSPLLHPGAMLRSEAFRAMGGYDAAFWTAQDADLWARMAPRFELDNLPEPLVQWRQHGSSLTSSRGAAGRELSIRVRVRQQDVYLGKPQPVHLVGSATDLLGAAGPLALSDISKAERYLAYYLTVARRREHADVLEAFRTITASSLLRQSRWSLRARRPRVAAQLCRRAARWRLGRGIDMATPILQTGEEIA